MQRHAHFGHQFARYQRGEASVVTLASGRRGFVGAALLLTIAVLAQPAVRVAAAGGDVYLPWVGRAAGRWQQPPTGPPPPTAVPSPTTPPPLTDVRLSEIAPTGSGLVDEDGEESDWIELHNTSDHSISLAGYTLSDDPQRPDKWHLPAVNMAADEWRVVFASGKDRPADPGSWGPRRVPDHWETAVADGSRWRFTTGRADIDAEWVQPDYRADGWEEGPGGIGYGDDDDGSGVPSSTLSVYGRTVFTVLDRSRVTELLLHMDFDDGFVAYLNGVEIARQGLDGTPPAWSDLATEHEAALYQGLTPDAFRVHRELLADVLVDGPNVLAVEVHNTAADSSDLTLRPFVLFGLADAGSQFGPNPPWFVPPSEGAVDALHTNYRLKAGETLTLNAPDGVSNDSVEIRSDLLRGHVMTRVAGTWCVSDAPSAGDPNGDVCFGDYAEPPVFSLPAGFYYGSPSVAIAGTDVRYTDTGQLPSLAATRYVAPLTLERSVVLRATAFEPGKLPSDVVTAGFLVDEPTTLPVISVSAAPGDLFSGAEGGGPAIYDNFDSGLKVPCDVAYFDTQKRQQFSERCAMRIVGNFSKAFAQKSMQFTFESDFGARGDVPNVMFSGDKPRLGPLHGFRVRNMDDDAASARMRDAIANRMALATHAAATASQNVAVFVNGEYWGHYVARELLNEYFVRDNYGADPDAVDIVKTHVGETFADAGSQQDFDDLVAFLTAADLTSPSAMNEARSRADLDNWVDYWTAQIYIANGDWYSSQWLNNIQAFRGRPPADNRWRFVLWDCAYSQDLGGGVTSPEFDSLDFALANPASPNFYTPMFQSLLRNDEFRRAFINRFADLINDAWTTERMLGMIDDNAARMVAEVSANYARWAPVCGDSYCPPDLGSWLSAVDQLKRFYVERPVHQRAHIAGFFDLEKPVQVTLDVQPPDSGQVHISTITPAAYPWQGVYFDGNPVTVAALPAPGFAFSAWSPNPAIRVPTDPEFTVNIDAESTTFVAQFSRLAAPDFVSDPPVGGASHLPTALKGYVATRKAEGAE